MVEWSDLGTSWRCVVSFTLYHRGQGFGWPPEPVWTTCIRENVLYRDSNCYLSVVQSVVSSYADHSIPALYPGERHPEIILTQTTELGF
jgi:hypothetical protein